MRHMKNAITAIIGIGALGVGVWLAASLIHDDGGGPPLPGSPKPAPVVIVAPKNNPQPMKMPQTQPAPLVASADPASLPSFLYFNYDHQPTSPQDLGTARQFPPSRLRVTAKTDEPVTTLLFSDDPKEAINKDWVGDRYYFSMTLQQPILDDRQLDGLAWVFTASPSEKEENGNGIFLHGDQFHLEPVQAQVHFQGQAPQLVVWIAGEFLQYDNTDPNAAPKQVWVTGRLAPKVEK